MTTSYKGYEITQCGSDRFIIRLDDENITTVKGSLSCAHFCIDINHEDMTQKAMIEEYEGYKLSISGESIIISKSEEQIKEMKGTVSDAKFYVDALVLCMDLEPKHTKEYLAKEKSRDLYQEAYDDRYGATMRDTYSDIYHEGYQAGAAAAANDIMG